MDLDKTERQCLERLVTAIVKQAAYDWRSAMAILKREPECCQAIHHKIDCEIFFLSDYFYLLTGLNGEAVLKRLNKEFNSVR